MNTQSNILEARQMADDISRHIRQVREIVELVADSLDDNRIDALYGASELCTKANEMCGDLECAVVRLVGEEKPNGQPSAQADAHSMKLVLKETLDAIEIARGIMTTQLDHMTGKNPID